MNKSKNVICPSSTCKAGSDLLGIVKGDGHVSILDEPILITEEFVKIANLGRKPEKRFRFANNCENTKCKQWNKNRCQVIDNVIDILKPRKIKDDLPNCPIRQNCRWYKQSGERACVVCPEVITDLR